MRFTFIDTFFAGAEFSSVYRLGNLFCTVPFRKITFLIDQVGFFLSIDSIHAFNNSGRHLEFLIYDVNRGKIST